MRRSRSLARVLVAGRLRSGTAGAGRRSTRATRRARSCRMASPIRASRRSSSRPARSRASSTTSAASRDYLQAERATARGRRRLRGRPPDAGAGSRRTRRSTRASRRSRRRWARTSSPTPTPRRATRIPTRGRRRRCPRPTSSARRGPPGGAPMSAAPAAPLRPPGADARRPLALDADLRRRLRGARARRGRVRLHPVRRQRRPGLRAHRGVARPAGAAAGPADGARDRRPALCARPRRGRAAVLAARLARARSCSGSCWASSRRSSPRRPSASAPPGS